MAWRQKSVSLSLSLCLSLAVSLSLSVSLPLSLSLSLSLSRAPLKSLAPCDVSGCSVHGASLSPVWGETEEKETGETDSRNLLSVCLCVCLCECVCLWAADRKQEQKKKKEEKKDRKSRRRSRRSRRSGVSELALVSLRSGASRCEHGADWNFAAPRASLSAGSGTNGRAGGHLQR